MTTSGDLSPRPKPTGTVRGCDGRIELPRPVAFVFGGGGSLGAIQVGMLRALSECGIAPDLVVGTSIGSLNGVMTAADPVVAADRLSVIWPTIKAADVLGSTYSQMVGRFRPSRPAVATHEGAVRLLSKYLRARDFAELSLPFGVQVYDVTSNRPRTITSGPLLPALCGSCSIPGVFPPVEQGDQAWYDGGLQANVAVRTAVRMGAKSLVVLDCMAPGVLLPLPANMQSALLFAVTVMLRHQADHDLYDAGRHMPVLYLPGPAIPPLGPLLVLDFSYTTRLIPSAYEIARGFLEDTTVSGPGVYGASPVAEPPEEISPWT